MLQGVKLCDLKKNVDDRGFFVELMRADWDVFLGDKIVQVNISNSYPDVTRAWHRHSRGQIDYFVVIDGAYKICACEEGKELNEFFVDSSKLQVVRIPGKFWHGYKCISNKPSKILNFVTKLYDYNNPDEERRLHDSIIDPRTGEIYVW